ncbi:MAG: hypothetical protein IJ262_08355 [Clostridia bacterium]|nr:hypothetical protein [Clostridia bacterium]
MDRTKNIVILGGDKRQIELYNILKEHDLGVEHIQDGNDLKKRKKLVSEAGTIILPIPVSKNGKTVFSLNTAEPIRLSDLKKQINDKAKIIGGNFSEKTKAVFKNYEIYDFCSDEALVLKNAYLTAQAALQIIFENRDCFINSQKVLISGFGRVSQLCALLLSSLGANIYIAARSAEQRAKAQCLGYKTLEISDIEKTVFHFDIIISTVPFNVFSHDAINKTRKNSLFIELASAPYGSDEKFFNDETAKYIFAPSLPGRYYPETSARIIYKTIKNLI